MKILLVEDDLFTREAIAHNLSQEGYSVITADDGIQALEVLEHQKVQLIISDILMPNMTGLGLLSILKNFYYDNIPVILISALDKGDVILSAVGLGAADFLVKPIDTNMLCSKIKKLTDRSGIN